MKTISLTSTLNEKEFEDAIQEVQKMTSLSKTRTYLQTHNKDGSPVLSKNMNRTNALDKKDLKLSEDTEKIADHK